MARNKSNRKEMYHAPFATNLRRLMAERQTSQGDIAAITDRTRQTVSQYVNGVSEPPFDTLVKIADYFGVSIDYLLGRTQAQTLTPAAVDELGLLPSVVSEIRAIAEADGYFDGNKKNCDGLNALNAFLYESFQTPLYDELEIFMDSLKAIRNSTPGNLIPENKNFYSEMGIPAEHWAIGNELTAEIQKKHPETAGQLHVVYGTRFLDYLVNDICTILRDIVVRATGYREYLNDIKKSGLR